MDETTIRPLTSLISPCLSVPFPEDEMIDRTINVAKENRRREKRLIFRDVDCRYSEITKARYYVSFREQIFEQSFETSNLILSR